MMHYTVQIVAPHTHELVVEVRAASPAPATVFHIPAWTPGSYVLREFARFLGEPWANDGQGRTLPVTKTAKGSWSVDTRDASEVVIGYTVFAHELTVRTPHVDGTHAFFNGTNALVFFEGRLHEPSRLTVHAPKGWDVHCPLPKEGGAYVASDYDVLADAIVEAGPHTTHSFEALGATHDMVFWGDDAVAIDFEKLAADTRALVEANAAVFDGVLPYEHYLFVFHITESGRGGLEHLNGTALATPWRYFDTEEGYREMLGLISHEHFHTWNIKRIRPLALGPFDYLTENHTQALWIAEGVTSYVDNLNCLRAGVVEQSHYLGWLKNDFERLARIPGRFGQTVAQSSYDAWIRLYSPDQNSPNRTVSYYLRGAMIAMGLDLTIRQETKGVRSLTDVLRALWAHCNETGRGFSDEELPGLFSEATGVDCGPMLNTWVYSTVEPPLEALLLSHGVALTPVDSEHPTFGWNTSARAGAIVVDAVLSDGPNAGGNVYAGDRLVALDHREVTATNWEDHAKRLSSGQSVRVHLMRRGRLIEAPVSVATRPAATYTCELVEAPSAEQAELRDAWWSQP
jgi:predicted metalloprotease with PDZ domain